MLRNIRTWLDSLTDITKTNSSALKGKNHSKHEITNNQNVTYNTY